MNLFSRFYEPVPSFSEQNTRGILIGVANIEFKWFSQTLEVLCCDIFKIPVAVFFVLVFTSLAHFGTTLAPLACSDQKYRRSWNHLCQKWTQSRKRYIFDWPTFQGLDHLGCSQAGNLPGNKRLDLFPEQVCTNIHGITRVKNLNLHFCSTYLKYVNLLICKGCPIPEERVV